MSYSDEIVNYLSPLVMQLGSVDLLHKLPARTVTEAMVFDEDLLAISDDRFTILLESLIGGYTIADSNLVERYTVETPESQMFGLDARDVSFLRDLKHGDYFFIAYNQDDATERGMVAKRICMVIYV